MESRLSRTSHGREGNTHRQVYQSGLWWVLLQRYTLRFLEMSDSPRGSQGGVYQEEKLELKGQEQPREQQQPLGTYFVRNYSKNTVCI